MARASWDETWREVAETISRRSACSERRVGAVVVSADNRDHWVGYNGPPAGYMGGTATCGRNCPQGIAGRASGMPCFSVHAEVNALMQSDRGLRAGGTVYVTAPPCLKCAVAVANSGALRLVCPPMPLENDEQALAVRVLARTACFTIDTWEDQ